MKYKALLFELVSRDIKIKYRRSVLGVLWTVLNPLFMMLILYMVFSHLFRFDIENYAIYILCGQVIFNFFQIATTDAMLSIISNGGLIRKIYIPKHLFVVSKVVSGVVNLAASMVALLVVMLISGTRLHPTFLCSVIPIAYVLVLALGVGLFLGALTVKFRDVQHLYSVFCTGLFYLTPVIYPMNVLPDSVAKVVALNPLTLIIQMLRCVVLDGTLPQISQILLCTLECAIILAIGLLVFKKRQDHFIMEL